MENPTPNVAGQNLPFDKGQTKLPGFSGHFERQKEFRLSEWTLHLTKQVILFLH